MTRSFFTFKQWDQHYGENQPASQWLKAILGFCGIINITFVYIDGLDAYPEKREEILNRAYSEIENKVIDF